jgi:hypothetical protein
MKMSELLTREVWRLTPKQYTKVVAERLRARYPNMTSAQAHEEAGRQGRVAEYYNALYRASEDGHRVPDRVMDRLAPEGAYRLRHDFPALYSDYMPPEIRRQNAQFEAEMRAARKGFSVESSHD